LCLKFEGFPCVLERERCFEKWLMYYRRCMDERESVGGSFQDWKSGSLSENGKQTLSKEEVRKRPQSLSLSLSFLFPLSLSTIECLTFSFRRTVTRKRTSRTRSFSSQLFIISSFFSFSHFGFLSLLFSLSYLFSL